MSDAAEIFNLALVAAGLGAWGLIVRQLLLRRPVITPVDDALPRIGFFAVAAVALFLGWQLSFRYAAEFGFLNESPRPTLGGIQNGVITNLLLAALFFFILSEAGQRRLNEFGVHVDRTTENSLAGLVGFLVSLPPVFGVMLLTSNLRTEETVHPYIRLAQESPTQNVYLWLALAVLIAAPLTEELIFRVILQGALRTRLSVGWSITISSVVFAGVHGFPDSLALLPLAVVLGYVFEKRRSYLAVVLLHALFNASMFVGLLLGSR